MSSASLLVWVLGYGAECKSRGSGNSGALMHPLPPLVTRISKPEWTTVWGCNPQSSTLQELWMYEGKHPSWHLSPCSICTPCKQPPFVQFLGLECTPWKHRPSWEVHPGKRLHRPGKQGNLGPRSWECRLGGSSRLVPSLVVSSLHQGSGWAGVEWSEKG